ncbi:hypothetical protein QBC39DRAFT_257957 [Podospora conica]|nr:hypothetical protein QBC39DRAFT_257957 [Schizothecium conicum]
MKSVRAGSVPERGQSRDGQGSTKTAAPPPGPAAGKSRRVRTGCLTCRERHLKCDEGLPDCNNCRKSSRECKRGVRLNFIDTQVKNPAIIPPTADWSVKFQDESRLIASEYRGGLGKYPIIRQKDITPPREREMPAAPLHEPPAPLQPPLEPLENNFPSPHRSWYSHAAASPARYNEPQRYDVPPVRQHKDSMSFPPITTTPPTALPAVAPISSGSPFEQFATRDDAYRRSSGRISDFFSLPSPFPFLTSAPTPQPHRATRETTPRPTRETTPQPRETSDGLITPPNEKSSDREYLSTEDEILFMQVFVDEVAVWMDVLDKDKHFANTLPYLALDSPMLLHAMLACGSKQHSMVHGHGEEKAIHHYDTATAHLLRCLKNPDRNTSECATAAVVLNVYETMSDSPKQRMNHIAGARALIRECGWDASSTGLGAACFWLNVGMEVLSCLAFNWQTAWDPDAWGLDLEFTNWTPTPRSSSGSSGGTPRAALTGDEELWVHRILYITARIANFRASAPRFQEPSPHDEQARRQARFGAWRRLKALCDAWNANCPRSMQTYGYAPTASSSTSLFPKVWIIRRPAVLGRLLYHTAMCLLTQLNPVEGPDSADNRISARHHAHHACGIAAHTRDPGVASGAIRCLVLCAGVLTDRAEQEEVLAILGRTARETGWNLARAVGGLKEGWGWEGEWQQGAEGAGTRLAPIVGGAAGSTLPVVNPLLVNADFGLPGHPYQAVYEPPTGGSGRESRGARGGGERDALGIWQS